MEGTLHKKHLTTWIIITVVLVAVAFYAGGAHAKRSLSKNMGQAGALFAEGGQRGGRQMGRFGAGAGFVTGSVLSKDDTSMTVKMRDGSSKIVLYTGTTQVLKSTTGAATDVVVGGQVSIQGAQNSDGSITAQSIQIRPDMPAVSTPTGTVPTDTTITR